MLTHIFDILAEQPISLEECA